MLKAITYQTPPPLTDQYPRLVAERTEAVIGKESPGFLIPDVTEDTVRRIAQVAQAAGLRRNAIPGGFRYERDVGTFLEKYPEGEVPETLFWGDYGVTPLHVDDDPATALLSTNHTLEGVHEIRLFTRGSELSFPWSLLMNRLHETNSDVLHGRVDPGVLGSTATRFVVGQGDMLVFDPTYVHMGVTTRAPRHSEAVFFEPIPDRI